MENQHKSQSAEYLPVAKAAKLLGISRQEVQQKIHDGELQTFEGKVSREHLKEVFPTASHLDDTPVLEKIQFIKDNSYKNRVNEAHIPDKYTLMGQVQRLRMQLRMAHDQEMAYRRLISELGEELKGMRQNCMPTQEPQLSNLIQLITQRLKQEPQNKA